MRIVPVLDVTAGVVVRGIAGRRSEYRPIVSRLTTSTRPTDVAEAFRTHFGLNHLYLADLDAIAGAAPALDLYRDLWSRGFGLWVDAGVRDATDAQLLIDASLEVVVGLETVRGPETLQQLVKRCGPERIIFSLDLKEGQPLGDVSAWREPEAEAIAAEVFALGVRRLIVLDLARVGVIGGTGTEALCQRLAAIHPEAELIAGGGVRGAADLRRLEECGVSSALVASALHDGHLQPSRAEL
jgi:phosphoribosylformimino-5-aminoimidazole carboxamide ribotide isomerase